MLDPNQGSKGGGMGDVKWNVNMRERIGVEGGGSHWGNCWGTCCVATWKRSFLL